MFTGLVSLLYEYLSCVKNSKQVVLPKWSATLSADIVSTERCQQMKTLQLYLLAHIFSCSASSHTFSLLLIIIT